MADSPARSAFVLGVTSDIGAGIAQRLLRDGWQVAGAGRDRARVAALLATPGFSFHECDLRQPASVAACAAGLRAAAFRWSLFASCAGTMQPIGRFF